jgi:NADH-quinone oxidoreductase subunit M
MNFPILSILILLPMVGVALIMMLNRENQWVIKGAAMAVALLNFIISLPLWFGFNGDTAAMQFVEKYSWVPSYGVSYYVGLDGIPL